MSGTAPEAGEIVLVPFPFTDLSASKSRPALVLSRGDYNASNTDIIVCAITSNLALASHSVLISATDVEGAKLPRPSRVKVDKLVTLHQDLVRKRFGKLKKSAFSQVLRELRALFPE